MNESTCGCCACLAGATTDAGVVNRPGLPAIRYRTGDYGAFYDAMIRRLSVQAPGSAPGPSPLHALTTRDRDDPAIAFLDAWAVVAHVLSFYQERIANEAYLRTATERRSVLELGRLVGYRLKPGVAASVYLAYTLDETADTVIPAGSKAQSIPGADERPQMFETAEAITARGAWNAIRPRMSRPQEITIETVFSLASIWIEGTTTRLETGDPLLFVFDTPRRPYFALRRTLKTHPDTEYQRTEIVFERVRPYYVNVVKVVHAKLPKSAAGSGTPPKPIEELFQLVLLGVPRPALMAFAKTHVSELPDQVVKAVNAEDTDKKIVTKGALTPLGEVADTLTKPGGRAPASAWGFGRSLEAALASGSDYVPRLMAAFHPQLARIIYTAIANNESGSRPYAQFRGVHVFRRRAAVFGYNAPTALFEERPTGHAEAGVPVPAYVAEEDTILHLDTPNTAITVDSYVVVQKAGASTAARVLAAETQSRTAYGISGQTTRLTLDAPWATFKVIDDDALADDDALEAMIAQLVDVRRASVLTESEELALAQAPVDRPIGIPADEDVPGSESERRIEIDGVFEGLATGRYVIVSGERLDTPGTAGIVSAELAMIDSVEQQPDAGAGGTAYSILALAPTGLAYQYDRATVRIYANVVKATHGETRSEILGGGDATRPSQAFTLHQAPLTFVSAPTVEGVTSTLAIRIDDVLWHEVETLAGVTPAERVFVTAAADDGKVTATFGNGYAGARPPSGADNIRAVYRSGIGREGNVRGKQIATAVSRPLGIRDVVNPLPASGGADPESRDDARRNIPVSLQAMGRVVSVRDYADFARTFAGISKAVAAALSDGRRRVVHLTVGGAGDIEIDVNSDLYRNLIEALRTYGDPYQPLTVQVREKLLIAGSARVRVLPDYLWTAVAPLIRAALVETFSYDRRDFGQPVYPAEVVAAIQRVRGVAYVDLDVLGAIAVSDLIPEVNLPSLTEVRTIVPRLARRVGDVLVPAQIACITPDLADLFILTEIVHD